MLNSLTISPQRARDIHSLNEQFIDLVLSGCESMNSIVDIDRGLLDSLQHLSPDERKRAAQTNRLLFEISPDGTNIADDERVLQLIERVNLVMRDFAKDDRGLAVTYLGATKARCEELLAMGVSDVREACGTQCSLKVIPLGLGGFKMLGHLANPDERTVYVTLAANDD
jgi:hypothetical protein